MKVLTTTDRLKGLDLIPAEEIGGPLYNKVLSGWYERGWENTPVWAWALYCCAVDRVCDDLREMIASDMSEEARCEPIEKLALMTGREASAVADRPYIDREVRKWIFEAVEDIDDETGEFHIDSEEVWARTEEEARTILRSLGGCYGDEGIPMIDKVYDAFRLAAVF